MYLLYSNDEINIVKEKLANGEKRFSIDNYNLEFSQNGSYYINRTENKFKGLAYDTTLKEVIINYPHINNVPTSFKPTSNDLVESKYNGTNIGFCNVMGKIYYRTRGSIEPEKVINELNTAILTHTYVDGVETKAMDEFADTHRLVIKQGIQDGFIDGYGNFIVKTAVDSIREDIEKLFSLFDMVGVFGELISKYNPIAVDMNLKYGRNQEDYAYKVFDVVVKGKEGYFLVPASEFFNMRSLERLDSHIGVVVGESPWDIHSLEALIYPTDEGVVVKSSNGYFKFKREEVISWQRLMGRLTSIIPYSVSHVFEESGFTETSVIEQKYFRGTGSQDIVKAVLEEISGYNMMEALERKFGKHLYSEILHKVQFYEAKTIMSFLSADIPKEKIWEHIPHYMDFGAVDPIVWNEKRGKLVPNGNYARMISALIGLIYLNSNRDKHIYKK